MHKFSTEELKRSLSIGEAACLWCDLPFSVLENALVAEGIPWNPDYPELLNAAEALREATDVGEIYTQLDEDGFPAAYKDRNIKRDDLIVWLKTYHPDHRPVSLFGTRKASSHTPLTPNVPKDRLKAEAGVTKEEPTGTNAPPTVKLIKLPQVRELTRLSKTKIYAMMSSGDFPKQKKVGRGSFWVESDVLEWNGRLNR